MRPPVSELRGTRAEIVAKLETQGMHFRDFTIERDSPACVDDWDWNQRDVPHVALVHGGFHVVPLMVGDDACTAVSMQRVLGLRLPLVLAIHHLSRHERVYVAALGPFVVVVEARLAARGPSGTLVTVRYSIGAGWVLLPVLPLIELSMRRNFDQVWAEDVPLQRRRSELRSWGYSFVADREGASYRASMNMTAERVTPPAIVAEAASIPLASLGEDGEARCGRDDHLGLRLVRQGARLLVFPRMCMHEGASLDRCPIEGDAIRCSWHGRKARPLATFDIASPAAQEATTPHHRLRFDGAELSVAPRGETAGVDLRRATGNV
jgi:nitrite reductase/ring-hydroxylating ferredoxin subunit